MLTQLHIRDLAVLEEVTVDFSAGFTVLTGETGAGKSILIDALALVVGERGDAQAIRAGASRLEVLASFAPGLGSDADLWLKDNDLGDPDTECLLRRVIGTDGRSKAWVNGRPVALQTLRELGGLLVDICGQQDFQALRHRRAHREVLDGLATPVDLLHRVRAAHAAWQEALLSLQHMTGQQQDRDSRLALLNFQVSELQVLNPLAGEFSALQEEHTALAHRQRIGEALELALARLYDDDEHSAQSALGTGRRALDTVLRFAPDLTDPLALLTEAEAQISEAADQLRQRLARLEANPGRETELADRLAALRENARKHRCTPDELPVHRHRLENELADLSAGGVTLDRLAEAVAGRRTELVTLTQDLTAGRRAAARTLAKSVTGNMATLGMPGGSFEVRVVPLPEGALATHGADEVEFLVTTNPGQPPASLGRVASGGELSRLNLAIQVVATAHRGAPTLIFDEVDAGVGGAVAEMVGRRLRELSHGRQVLCITHLPQVATLAEHQTTVSKHTRGGKTSTTVQVLTPAERVEETARMLGGVQLTDHTRAHAEEMLALGRAPSRGSGKRQSHRRS